MTGWLKWSNVVEKHILSDETVLTFFWSRKEEYLKFLKFQHFILLSNFWFWRCRNWTSTQATGLYKGDPVESISKNIFCKVDDVYFKSTLPSMPIPQQLPWLYVSKFIFCWQQTLQQKTFSSEPHAGCEEVYHVVIGKTALLRATRSSPACSFTIQENKTSVPKKEVKHTLSSSSVTTSIKRFPLKSKRLIFGQKNNPIFWSPSKTSTPVGVKPKLYWFPSLPCQRNQLW